VIIGIVVALPEELTTLTAKKMAKGSCLGIADKLWVVYSGAGPANAAAAAQLLIAKGANRLISWGCAGALSGALKPGDLVLADSLIDAENVEMNVDVFWHDHAQDRLAAMLVVHTGCLAESVGIVASSKDKKQLHAVTGAVAVDMESVAIAKLAWQYAIPFLSIRAIADPVSMDLPPAISHALNAQGDIVLWKLLVFLMLHPAELPSLIRLGLHFNAAIKTLKTVAQCLEFSDA
jgi:hopanoid-associated phosphorylase